MKSFVHLHVHSYYSILDGMSSIKGLVDKASSSGMKAIALTDHGNMFGIKEFFNYVKKKNAGVKDDMKKLKEELNGENLSEEEKEKIREKINTLEKKLFKPILGCEAYVARRGRKLKDKDNSNDRSGYHLVLLAKNLTGYKNLCKLVSLGWMEGFYYRPRIDHEILEKYSEGLIATSACLGGEIHKKVEKGNLTEAEESIMWYKKVFGDDYYLELQLHETDKPNADYETYKKQRSQNQELINLARKTGTKLVATNDVHFVEEEHGEAHERLICLSTGKDLDDPSRMRYTKQEYLKSPEKMWEIFKDLPEALENSVEIADKIDFFDIDSAPMMPVYPIPESFGTEEQYREKFSEEVLKEEFGDSYKNFGGYDKIVRVKLEADYLRELTLLGAAKRYGEKLNEETSERIDFELNVMKTMGFPGYFLIVQDFIQSARNMGVSVGPGRGSAAGSVVAYCLRITDIDPLKYDLLFERFLNPDRISMPDIDIDFDDDGRGQVLRWVTEKYGKEKVAHIITYGTMATKSSIKDVARVQKLPLSEAERLTKLIPDKLPEDRDGNSPKINIANCLKFVPMLQQARNSTDNNLSSTLRYAEMLEGTVRQTGVHACGVIIGAEDLTNCVPLSTAVDKETNEEMLVTQYEGSVIEEIGLIKMDFLGLKTLSIIKEAISNVKKSKGDDIDIDAIPIDDKKTYELFSKGLTVGTFQFESNGMQKYLRDLQPTQFEDLIAMNALYRPGPMQYIPQFVNRKHGREEIEYPFPVMEGRLKDTYGITVYQEQVMLLSRDLAGFTRGQSDELRKAMGKKLVDKMAALEIKFLDGCKKNGFGPEDKVKKIWADWAEFAKYAFNKSHATCYSWIAYQTAFLKAHYPAEFLAANLTRNKDDISEVSKFMDECRNMGINVFGPDVNESELTFTVNPKGDIRFGLGGIKGVGEGAVEAIVQERKKNGRFKNIFDFIERVSLTSCNKKAIESLVFAGAFDCFPEMKREQFFIENSKGEIVIESIIRYGNKFQSDNAMNQNSLFGGLDTIEIQKPEIPFASDWSPLEKLGKEREYIGMFLSAHPLDDYEFELNFICNTKTTDLKDLAPLMGKSLKIGGMVTAIRHGTSKAGNPYGILTLEDYDGAFEFALFGSNYIDFSKFMIKDLYLMIYATVQEKGADRKYQVAGGDKSPELKIQKIEILNDIRDKLVDKLTMSMPLDHIDEVFATDLSDMILRKKGNINIYFNVYDHISQSKVKLFSRQFRVQIDKEFFKMLKKYRDDGKLDFQVN
jgi:DNA polymerase-3 subunit alpha